MCFRLNEILICFGGREREVIHSVTIWHIFKIKGLGDGKNKWVTLKKKNAENMFQFFWFVFFG